MILDKKITSHSPYQTRRLAKKVADYLLEDKLFKSQAAVLALAGELGSGKTVFVRGFADGLGIKQKIVSPTFIIMHPYHLKIPHKKEILNYTDLYHIDVYRLKNTAELIRLGVKRLFLNPRAIVLLEWADRVRTILPPQYLWLEFKHYNHNMREINIKFQQHG